MTELERVKRALDLLTTRGYTTAFEYPLCCFECFWYVLQERDLHRTAVFCTASSVKQAFEGGEELIKPLALQWSSPEMDPAPIVEAFSSYDLHAVHMGTEWVIAVLPSTDNLPTV